MLGIKTPAARSFVRMLLVLMAAIGATVVVAPSSPAFAVGCNSDGCTGKDPQAQGCSSGAHSMPKAYYGDGYGIELRLSPACDAMWTRLKVDYQFDPTGYYTFRVERQRWNGQADEWQSSGVYTHSKFYGTGTVWTKMVADYSSGDRTRACVGINTAGNNIACTGWQ
jgi:uncharacterized protein DUF2690